MHVKQSQEKHSEYIRHKSYLKRLKNTSLFCPRYDMLSLNNNLLLHRNYDPKKELVPRRPSEGIRQLEQQIKRKREAKQEKPEYKPASKWYESVLRDSQVADKKFKFEYYPASSSGFTVRESLNRLYQRKVCSRGKSGSFSNGSGQTAPLQ